MEQNKKESLMSYLGMVAIFAVVIFLMSVYNNYQKRSLNERYQACNPVRVEGIDSIELSNQCKLYVYHLSDKSQRYINAAKKPALHKNDSLLYLVDRGDEITDYRVLSSKPEQ